MSGGLLLPSTTERSTAMQVLHEAAVLARYAERVAEANVLRRRSSLVRAIKAQRRAERASARARRLLAVTGLQ